MHTVFTGHQLTSYAFGICQGGNADIYVPVMSALNLLKLKC